MQHRLTDRSSHTRYPVPISDERLPSTELRPFYSSPQEKSPTLSDFFEILVRRRGLIFGFVLVVLIPTLWINVKMKPLYKAEGLIEMNPESARVTKFENVTGNSAGRKSEEFYLTQMHLLQSAALARRVIERLELDKHPSFNPALAEQTEKKDFVERAIEGLFAVKSAVVRTVESLFSSGEQVGGPVDPNYARLRTQKWMEGLFGDALKVEAKFETSIIEVTFDSTNPALAADVVNVLIDEYSNWQMDRRIDAAKTAKEQLEKQIKLARNEVDRAESKILLFSKERGIVSLDSRLNLVYQQLEKINEALAKAEAERIQKEEFYNQAKTSDISSTSLVMQNGLISGLKQQYIDLMGEYERLRVFFKDDYPTVKNLKAKMLEIGKKIDAEEQRMLTSFKNEYLAASKVEKALQTTAEEKKVLALQLNEYASQYKNLEREVEINKQIFQSLLERSKEIEANVGTDLGNMKVVDLATPPLRPYKPKIFRNVFLALMLGLVGGVGLALVRETLDRTVRRIDEISDEYLIRILGVLPLARKDEIGSLDSLVRVSPSSLFSEAIRAAKASLSLITSNEGVAKSILITGTTSGEGKTTIAANLAQAYAGAGEKVLVIDADLRRPRMGRLFGNNGQMGLSHFLNGVCSLDDIVQETSIPNLHFIGSGPASSKLAELLASSRMKELMTVLSGQYDHVIVDSPPFGVFADVMILGTQVDGVILVTALGKTHRDDIRIFCRKLSDANGRVLGSIVNKLDIDRYNGSYYRKQYRSYYARRPSRGSNLPVEIDLTDEMR